MDGQVFNIMKYAVHDGPGIRTTVFLKGCPLSCLWCHNPESQDFNKQLTLFPNRCIGCGECIKVCNSNAISIVDDKLITDLEKCSNCGDCTNVCFAEAREMTGKTMTVEEVVKEILKDKIFYEESGGGVTFSGGEPLAQSSFLIELLNQMKKLNIHTTIDTCGFSSESVFREVADLADLFLFDLKHMNSQKHHQYTGVHNSIILENIKMLNRIGKEVIVRIPIIPGFNDDKKEVEDFIIFIKTLSNVKGINLLPYHNIGQEKYNRIGKRYLMKDVPEPSQKDMEYILELFQDSGAKVKIGG